MREICTSGSMRGGGNGATAEPLRHRQTKGAANRYAQPNATAPHSYSTKPGQADWTLTESSRRRGRFGRGLARTHRADDRLLGLDDEEEDEAAKEEPRPDAKRHALGLEQGL